MFYYSIESEVIKVGIFVINNIDCVNDIDDICYIF